MNTKKLCLNFYIKYSKQKMCMKIVINNLKSLEYQIYIWWINEYIQINFN